MLENQTQLSWEETNDKARQTKTAVQYKILWLKACTPTHKAVESESKLEGILVEKEVVKMYRLQPRYKILNTD
jgi:hypothetical protein